MITEVLSGKPKELIFDLTQSEFVSAQGYDAIGRCSLRLPVQVRSRTGLAARVFAVLGYEEVNVVTGRESEGTCAVLMAREKRLLRFGAGAAIEHAPPGPRRGLSDEVAP